MVSAEHWTNFFLSAMPAFCVGSGESHWGPVEDEPFLKIPRAHVPGSPALASAIEAAAAPHLDLAWSQELKLDHGVMVPLHLLAPSMNVPLVPVIINCLAQPMPRLSRCWTLGRAVREACDAYPGRVAESTPEQWRASFEVNVTGAVALTLALLPALRAARGQVVFINSGSGLNPSPGLASYAASKFALRAFADSLRADEPLLRVTSIHPGRVDTDMQRDLVAYEGGEYDPARFLSPQTVAGVVAQVVATPPDAHNHQVVIRPRR